MPLDGGGEICMALFGNLFRNSFDSWLENASDMELSEGYEERRK